MRARALAALEAMLTNDESIPGHVHYLLAQAFRGLNQNGNRLGNTLPGFRQVKTHHRRWSATTLGWSNY